MTTRNSRRSPAGFTLVELMVVVAIIGLLASVAMPQFQRAALRARAAERLTVMQAIAGGVNDVIMQNQGVPGGMLVGAANPPAPVGTTMRAFNWTLAGWNRLPMVVMGGSYYSYNFIAQDPGGNGANLTLDVFSVGDLDGDNVTSGKHMAYAGVGYTFSLVGETPARGEEDLTTF
ncbi:MAG: prepilin-type N-terminal cleavage/methylation domain-containing protein [Anaeromyxobacter sp.]